MPSTSDENLIPSFRPDGYLPEGLFPATLTEITTRFGTSSRRRRFLTIRLRRWAELAHATGVSRMFIDGSFVTSKKDPNDIDAVVMLANDFRDQVLKENHNALELENMLLTRQPEELFAAEDARDWEEWIEFFSRTRESDERRKGLVELIL
jgi:hypothetical protein